MKTITSLFEPDFRKLRQVRSNPPPSYLFYLPDLTSDRVTLNDELRKS